MRAPPATQASGLPVAAAAALLVAVPVLVGLLVESSEESASVASMAAPIGAVAPWELRTGETADWRPHFSGGSARLEQTFRRGGSAVDLFVEVFPLPSRAGAELISYGNSIHAESNERLFPDRVVRPRSGALGPEFRVRETMVQGSRDRLVWYWYDVGGHQATSGVRAKLLEARTLVTAGRSAQRVVVVSTLVTSSREEAAERLQDFLATHAPALGLGTFPGS
jgi:EpsI family protein